MRAETISPIRMGPEGVLISRSIQTELPPIIKVEMSTIWLPMRHF